MAEATSGKHVRAHGFFFGGEVINPSRSERRGVTWSLVVGGCSMGSSYSDESGSRDETRNRAGFVALQDLSSVTLLLQSDPISL